MKLEIKHLAPYLPYGLKLVPNNYRSIAGGYGYYHRELDIDALNRCNIEDLKPILRPLSDLALLTSPLTILDLNRMRGGTISDEDYDVIEDDGECIICKWGGVRSFYLERQTMSFYDNSKSGISPQLDMFNALFEHHFDVFGLIPAGLAIDINTLKS